MFKFTKLDVLFLFESFDWTLLPILWFYPIIIALLRLMKSDAKQLMHRWIFLLPLAVLLFALGGAAKQALKLNVPKHRGKILLYSKREKPINFYIEYLQELASLYS